MANNLGESELNEQVTSQLPDDQVKAPGRRKLVIGAVPVVASLISRPIWAIDPHTMMGRCTISGAFSGPSSGQDEQLCGGLTPGYWKNAIRHPWPSPYQTGSCNGSNGQGNCQGWAGDGTLFSTVFPVCATLLSGRYPAFDWANADLMKVLQEDKSGNNSSIDPALQFAFHVVAGLLNSAAPAVNYGYTAGEFMTIIENFCLHFNGSTGPVPGAGQMTIDEFKSLLDRRNNGDFSG